LRSQYEPALLKPNPVGLHFQVTVHNCYSQQSQYPASNPWMNSRFTLPGSLISALESFKEREDHEREKLD
jgi:hypothetical protein